MKIFNFLNRGEKETPKKITLDDIDFYTELENVDNFLAEALVLILNTKEASTSLLQRKMKLGYSRASRIIDQLEEMGIISSFDGTKSRQLILDDLAEIKEVVNKYLSELALKIEEQREIEKQEEIENNKYKAEIQLDMSRNEIIDLLGVPSKIEENVSAKKKVEKFYYGAYLNRNNTNSFSRMIKLENDKVVGWKDL